MLELRLSARERTGPRSPAPATRWAAREAQQTFRRCPLEGSVESELTRVRRIAALEELWLSLAP